MPCDRKEKERDGQSYQGRLKEVQLPYNLFKEKEAYICIINSVFMP
jgi:hypothetical protein